MPNRGKFRRKMVFPVTIVRSSGERQLAHTLDVTEISARLAGVGLLLQPGEIVEIQRGGRKARFRVYWMGAPGTKLAGQAGVRGLDTAKSIWSIHLPTDEPDVSADALHLRDETPSSQTPVALASEPEEPVCYECNIGATLRAPGSNYPVRVQVRYIHLNGLFVETNTTLPLNTLVTLEMQIEGVAMETAGVVVVSTGRVGMEISFHKVSAETQRRIVLALQKLKQKAWDEQQVPPVPENVVPAPRSTPPAAPSAVPPLNCVDAGRVLVAICRTLSSDFEAWKSTRTPTEIEELRKALSELQQRLSPSAAIDIGEYFASGASNRGGQA
jgi:hypothetical protein